MDKKVLIAFVLSTIIIAVYWYYFSQQNNLETVQTNTQQASNNQNVQENITPIELDPVNTNIDNLQLLETTTNEEIRIETENYNIIFNSQWGTIKSLELKKYDYYKGNPIILYKRIWNRITGSTAPPREVQEDKLINMIGDAKDLNNFVYLFSVNKPDEQVTSYLNWHWDITNQTIKFFSSTPTQEIEKAFKLDDTNYTISIQYNITNRSGNTQIIYPRFIAGVGNELITEYYRPKSKVAMTLIDGNFKKHKLKEPMDFSGFKWIALTDVYFITGIKPSDNNWQAHVDPISFNFENTVFKDPLTVMNKNPFELNNGEKWSDQIEIFAGPKDIELLNNFDESFSESLDLFLNILARPMLILLRLFHSFVNNWGVAIMMLTVVVRLLLFPLAFSGMKSMKNMSKLNPRIKILRKKYVNDKQKLNTEIMQLYKKNKANPISGCLPLIAQIPIFIALYWTLLPAIELRHQPFFGWLNDISNYDSYMILPLLMGITMFIQQRISPPPANLDPIQQKIMMFLPIMMTLFFVNFPAGLVLYWVTSNIITILQQLVFNRIKVKEIIE